MPSSPLSPTREVRDSRTFPQRGKLLNHEMAHSREPQDFIQSARPTARRPSTRSIALCPNSCARIPEPVRDLHPCPRRIRLWAFRERERMATRFHPFNVFPQGTKENRFERAKEWEFGKKIDEMH